MLLSGDSVNRLIEMDSIKNISYYIKSVSMLFCLRESQPAVDEIHVFCHKK